MAAAPRREGRSVLRRCSHGQMVRADSETTHANERTQAREGRARPAGRVTLACVGQIRVDSEPRASARATATPITSIEIERFRASPQRQRKVCQYAARGPCCRRHDRRRPPRGHCTGCVVDAALKPNYQLPNAPRTVRAPIQLSSLSDKKDPTDGIKRTQGAQPTRTEPVA
jgi:hypothetical protein